MKGQILDYSVQSNTGNISGNDGNRYQFSGAEWKSAGVPSRGSIVDFENAGNQAKAVYIAVGTVTPGSKNKVAAVRSAVEAGASVCAKRGLLVNKVVIPNPKKELLKEMI